MSDQPEEALEDSFTLSMPVPSQKEEYHNSPVHHFNNLAWYLYMFPLETHRSGAEGRELIVECDSESKSELWQVATMVEITVKTADKSIESKERYLFNSWRDLKHVLTRRELIDAEATEVIVKISILEMNFHRRPFLGPKSWIHDVTLVVEGEKYPVNKEIFSSISRFFKDLFNSNSNQEEIEIKGFNSEDFHELLSMVFGGSTEPSSVENAIRYFTMANTLDLKVVKDRIQNFLLATGLISVHRKILIAEQHKMRVVKVEVLRLYKTDRKILRSLSKSPAYAEFPAELVKEVIFPSACSFISG